MAKISRAQRMDTVIKLAQNSQQQASTEMAAINKRVQLEQQRLEHLQQLQAEYLKGLRVAPGSTCSVRGLQHGMAVVQQIDTLAGGQQRLVDQLLLQQKHQRQKLEQCWLRCKNLQDLQAQYREQDTARSEKQQMKAQESDSNAARQTMQRNDELSDL